MKNARRTKLKIIIGLILVLAISSNLPWGKAFFKTLIILPEFISNSPVKTIQIFTPKPQVTEVVFKSGKRTIYADLWLPKKKGTYPAVVLSLGVDIDRKDERIQRLANVIARSGIATLVPNIPSLHRRRLLAEARDDLISSFEYLRSKPNIKGGKVGFFAF